jgi:hypothetical protein
VVSIFNIFDVKIFGYFPEYGLINISCLIEYNNISGKFGFFTIFIGVDITAIYDPIRYDVTEIGKLN